MSVTYGFFNANLVEGNYDRKYTADQLAEFFASLIGNGVSADYGNSFQVVPSSGLTVSVSPGFAWINGFWAKNDSAYAITESAVPASGYRQDLIVLRFDRSDRSITPILIQGTVSSTIPAPMPKYTRTDTQYDLVLAAINLSAGNSAITANMITDLRANDEYCGIVDTFANRLVPVGSINSEKLADGAVTNEKTDFSAGFAPAGPIRLTKGIHYFDSEADLPEALEEGRVYFVALE